MREKVWRTEVGYEKKQKDVYWKVKLKQGKPLCSSLRRRVNLPSRLMIKKPLIDSSKVNKSQ
jgi:hypothetical protein